MIATRDIFCQSCGEPALLAPFCPSCGRDRRADLRAGAPLWQTSLGQRLPHPRCYPVIAAGRLCLPTEGGAVVALDADTGQPAWVYNLPASTAAYALASDGERVFIGPYDTAAVPRAAAALVALDAASGAEAWRFDGGSHSYAAPTVAGGTLYTALASGQVVALDAATGALRWAKPHPDWGPSAPAVADGLVLVGGRGETLAAYDAASGRERWRFEGGGWFASRVAVADGAAFARCWDGFLYALELETGALRWKLHGERGQGFSSPPAVGPGGVLIGDRVRGEGRYALRALRATDGTELWRRPLPSYVQATPALHGDLALCPCDDRQLYALDQAPGRELWAAALAAEPTSRPLVRGETVYVADRSGEVFALRLGVAGARGASPERLLAAGDVEGAAVALVLDGAVAEGAALIGEQLGRPGEAARLLERFGLHGAAASHWERAGEIQRARDAYAAAGDRAGLADHLARSGETLDAARMREELGDLEVAAALYEQAGDRTRAAELLAQVGKITQANRVVRAASEWERAADELAQAGQPAAAADLLAAHGQIERAAGLFEQAGALADALALRLELKHWARAAELALGLDDLEHAAVAYEQLGRRAEAGELFERAAGRALAGGESGPRLAADLYERAAGAYDDAGEAERAAAALQEVARHRQLPRLQVTVLVDQNFIEQEWNTATVELRNVGFGPARSIRVSEALRFELGGAATLANLAPGRELRQIVSLRPRASELGQRVPLELTVAYRDAQNTPYEERGLTFVRVVARGQVGAAPLTPPSPMPPMPAVPEALASSGRRQARRLDAMVPRAVTMGETARLVVQVRFPNAPRLSAEDWPTRAGPDDPEAGSGEFDVVFPVDPETRALRSAWLTVRVRTTAFQVDRPEQRLEVQPGRYSRKATFLLTPRAPGPAMIEIDAVAMDGSELGTASLDTSIGATATGEAGERTVSIDLRLRVERPEVPLTLRFEQEPDGVEVTWEADVIGTYVSRLTPPYAGADLDLVVRALDLLQFPSDSLTADELARLAALGLPLAGGLLAESAHRAVGQALYRALVADQRGAEALSTVRNYARAEGRALDLRLRFPPAAIELAALPWELLWDEGPNPLLIGRGQMASCTRHLDLPEAVPPPRRRQGALRILAVTPHAGVGLEERERERAERTAAWGPLIASGEVVMEELSPATRRAIFERIHSGPTPDIIHFLGHGRYLDGEGRLVLDGADGAWDRVPASRLIALFGETRLVVLCACQGATVGEGGLLTGVAPALSAAGVPAVVAMQLTVRTGAATRFSEVLYRSLARGESLQRAVVRARQALYVEEQDGASWYVPTVTIRTREPGPLYLFET